MEAFQIVGTSNPLNRNGMVDVAGGFDRIQRRGDDTGLGGDMPQLFGQFSLADNQTADVHFDGFAGHFRLVAADDHGVFAVEGQTVVGLRQGNDDLAGNSIYRVAGVIDNLTFQNTQ